MAKKVKKASFDAKSFLATVDGGRTCGAALKGGSTFGGCVR
jgi:hypothetical protein